MAGRSQALRLTARALGVLVLLLALYLALWPVPVDPVAWDAPADSGLVGPFAPNRKLEAMELLPLGGDHGPEALTADSAGRLYTGTAEGNIVRFEPDGSNPVRWARTGGRPLGLAFAPDGSLVVADALKGLLSISPEGVVTTLATEADGIPIGYADDVDVAGDGRIFFSDASTRFPASQGGGTYDASLLEIIEHRGSGRLLVYDPATRRATTVAGGLAFANGVAVSHDQRYVLVNETASYRVLRVRIDGAGYPVPEPVLENLPGFPDNLTRGRDGRFWIALISPRNRLLDRVAGRPFLRKVIQRLPAFLRPKAVDYTHVVAFHRDGRVVASLQDPGGRLPANTSALETERYLLLGSLAAGALGRITRY